LAAVRIAGGDAGLVRIVFESVDEAPEAGLDGLGLDLPTEPVEPECERDAVHGSEDTL
jgi:hypothetical protein